MAEDSAFWGGTTVGDAASADIWKAPYTSEEWSDIWSKMFASDSASGFVIPLHENELAVEAEDPASMDISILSGVATIRGRLYENTATASLTIGANASGNPRIDRIILRTSFAAQTIRLAVLQGTPGAAPTLPTLTQDANTWEVSLAYIWVANGAATIPNEEIHDERVFLKTSLSHKYAAGSQNLIKNSEFMGFSGLSGGATTNPPDGWSLESTPSDISSYTRPAQMMRGRAVQVTADGANEGISQSFEVKPDTPYTIKALVNTNTGDTGIISYDYQEITKNLYSESNQNTGVPLRKTGTDTTTISPKGSGSVVIGTQFSVVYKWGQSFQIAAGKLTQFTFTLASSVGSPTGTVTWNICENDSGVPGASLVTGTLTPTENSTNTVSISSLPNLVSSTMYWLTLESTVDQASGKWWSWDGGNSYAGGYRAIKSGANPWTAQITEDLASTFTTSVNKDKLAQGILIDADQFVNSATLYLSKVGLPTGTLTLRIETDSAGNPSGTLVNANATATVLESSLGIGYRKVLFTFLGSFTLSASTQYHLVLSTNRASSADNYVLWGADSSPSYTGGTLKSQLSGVYDDEEVDGCFEIIGDATVSSSKIIRRENEWIEEIIYFPNTITYTSMTISLLAPNNTDIVRFGQILMLEGRHPGPFREIHETILFKDGITDSNWSADAKSDSTTTIDLDSDFQALVLPGTRKVLVGLVVQETTTDILTTYATSNQNTGVELQGAAGIDRLAQSFQIAAPATVDRISLYLKKTGSPTGSLTVYLETNTAGSPSGTLVHANSYSSVIPEADLSTSYVLITFYLRGAIALAATTTYWIVLYTNRASDATNFITWGADSSAPAYASGEMKSQNGGSWSAETKDACFVVLGSINLASYLAARFTGGSKDYVKASCLNAVPLSYYYEQGWVDINPSNQFDLYVVDTTASSIVCSARILGINI